MRGGIKGLTTKDALGAALFALAALFLSMWYFAPESEGSVFEVPEALVTEHRLFQGLTDTTVVTNGPNSEIYYDFPESILIGEAFLITARLDYPGIDILSSYPLKMELNIAGAEVAPSSAQTVGTSLEVNWSVVLKEAGIHEGFTELAFIVPREDFPNERERILQLLTESRSFQPFQIEVLPKPKGFLEHVSSLGLLIGLLLSITGIVTFCWAYLDRRRARHAERQTKKPKVFLPGDF